MAMPARRLDVEDLGADLREQQPGQMAAVIGQIEHSDRREHQVPLQLPHLADAAMTRHRIFPGRKCHRRGRGISIRTRRHGSR